jgi:hypothetical protein
VNFMVKIRQRLGWKQFFSYLVIILVGVISPAVTVTFAQGHTSDQLSDEGWTCVNTGPHNWMHCFPP